ncbi:MAG: hypothetical protein FD161_2996 [Limisphaerales bacterium]|nr:MAG: hypothetical protein FD161_2996 [Limisphaerales bacterium]KAG0508109.1 MAG: hypothetical protein E1N63_2703 [Limisphaerales bacterium]TXT53038.1 MAG: hypothetical protein FD140_146 [Limisphaerales bacterium]
MSHPHAGDGAKTPSAGQSQTLFFTASKAKLSAMLVTECRGKFRSRAMRFPSAQAALDWCLEHDAGLVMSKAENPALN